MDPISQTGNRRPAPARRRVLVVDDHAFFGASVRALLNNESDLVVCDVLTSSLCLQERISQLQPDLLMIDVALGRENGVEVARHLRCAGVCTPILFVSSLTVLTQTELSQVAQASFVAKTASPADFLAALRAALCTARGESSDLAAHRSAVRN